MLVTVDTGGTKTLIAGFEKDGSIGRSVKFPTPKSQAEYVTRLHEALRENFGGEPVEVVVIALPGIIQDGVAQWCNNLGWKDFDARAAFAGVLGDAPILVENDANLAGLSETRVLDPVPTSSLYVTVSTGIGTGIITNGHIDPGLRRSEGGRMEIEFDGMLREWETFASGRVIRDVYGKYARDIASRHTWHEIADRISRGLLAAIPLIQPDIIIIGGSVGTFFGRYGKQLEDILREKLPPHIPCPPLIQAAHPEEAVVYGGYYYATDYLAGN